MPTKVYRPNEISLFETYYPIIGEVEPLLASQFASKQVIGDYTKDSEQIKSSWIMSDSRGGIGIKDMQEYGSDGRPKDTDRVWWSTSELGFYGHHTLPVLVTDTGAPGSAGADPALLIEYANGMYAFAGTTVHLWNEEAGSWGDSLNTQPATPTSGAVHKGRLYAACDSDFVRLSGSWIRGTALSSGGATPHPCDFLLEWEGKLFSLDQDGQLDYTIDDGVTWITNAKSTLPADSFTSMFEGRDAADNRVIYMGTKFGLYVLDFEAEVWRKTDLELPFHDHACKGAAAHFDASYIPSGMSLYEHKPGRDPGVDFVGLDADYGVPGEYNGSIVKILSTLNGLYALVDATLAVTQDTYVSGGGTSTAIYDDEGYSAIFKWRNPGWSVIHLSTAAATPIVTGVVASADDLYRLWFGMDGHVWFFPLQITVQNPLEVSTYEFAASSETISPWFDKDNSVTDAIAVCVNGLFEKMSSDETIKLSVGLNGDDDTWTLLTNSAFPDGFIDVSGEVEFEFALGAGTDFKSIRFKEEYARGVVTIKAPDRRWIRLAYVKLLEPKYGFNVKVDCSRNYRLKSKNTMANLLRTALVNKTLGVFNYRENGFASDPHRVRLADYKGKNGVYDLFLVAP